MVFTLALLDMPFGVAGYAAWQRGRSHHKNSEGISQLAESASAVPERLGCCHGPAQAQGQYAQWARKHLHRESLREVSRGRHAALDRLLLRPTETFAGAPDHCRMMDDSPNDPGAYPTEQNGSMNSLAI